MKIHNKSGNTYGRWTVVSFSHYDKNRHSHWNCVCECGAKRSVCGGNLTTGESKSCGCLQKDNAVRGGMSTSKTYYTWRGMVHRCTNKNAAGYENYGGRGITVCSEWLDFDTFITEMGERPSDRTLERIDNNKGYSKDNCVWATKEEQGRNKRNNKWFNVNGERKIKADCVRELGINGKSIDYRLNKGETMQEIYNHFKK